MSTKKVYKYNSEKLVTNLHTDNEKIDIFLEVLIYKELSVQNLIKKDVVEEENDKD